MPNWRAVRRLQASATPKSRFGRQVPLSGEESPPQYPVIVVKIRSMLRNYPSRRGPRLKSTGPSGGFSGRLHRL